MTLLFVVGTRQNMIQIWSKCLIRARKVNLRLNPHKCKFGVSLQVQYVGHIFSSRGLLADPKKVDAIVNMPKPEDVNALSRFRGYVQLLVQVYSQFEWTRCPPPPRQLKHKDVQWCWLEQHHQAYNKIKAMIATVPPSQILWCVKTSHIHLWRL